MELEAIRDGLGETVLDVRDPFDAADRLCRACATLLEVDGASVSLIHSGVSQGTFGASGPLGRTLDELQFTFGEGPCIDAAAEGRPVGSDDLAGLRELRWPAFRGAVGATGVRAVFALPVSMTGLHVGALDLYRSSPGPWSDATIEGGALAADFATVPLRALMNGLQTEEPPASAQTVPLPGLDRVEIYQATGMIIAALDVGPDEALARLRAHAFATGTTASEVAWAIVDRRVTLDDDRWRGDVGGSGAAS